MNKPNLELERLMRLALAGRLRHGRHLKVLLCATDAQVEHLIAQKGESMTTADATDAIVEPINDQTAAVVEAMTALTDVLRDLVNAVNEIGS